eukprot:6925819-Pyramimonas_sp.AAC.1
MLGVGWCISAAAPPKTRARCRNLVWRDRRGCGGADRWANPSVHFSGSRRIGRARYHGNVDD